MKLSYKLRRLWFRLLGFGGNEEIGPFSFESFEKVFGLQAVRLIPVLSTATVLMR